MRALDLLISYANSRWMTLLILPDGDSVCVSILDPYGVCRGSVSALTLEAACEALAGIVPVSFDGAPPALRAPGLCPGVDDEVPDTLPPEWAA